MAKAHHRPVRVESPGEPGPFLRLVWTDPATGTKGYVVIHRLAGGLATGGTRMRPGCTLEEVEDLARGMSYKTGALSLPVGGAKGGIDYDPFEPDAKKVLKRFVAALRPVLDHYWVTAEDLGVSQPLLDEVFAELGMGTSLHAALSRSKDPDRTLRRVRQAFTAQVEGIAMPDVIGGFGVAEAAMAAMEHLGGSPRRTRAVVQGFGSMGGSTARYLTRQGVRVVGVADARGTLVNEREGLDVEKLLRSRNNHGEIDRSALGPHDKELPRDDWLSVEADLLIPAAVSYAITADNCDRVAARLVVEAANVPTTEEAEERLLERGVAVVPDFIANAGAVGWAWWVLLGDVSADPQDSFDKLSSGMRPVVHDLMRWWTAGKGSPRQRAGEISQRNLDELARKYGGTAPSRRIL